ncbi:MAG: zinc dependent phospholipase C family protein [Christensenellales bacterium]
MRRWSVRCCTQKTDDFLLALCEACAGDALLRAYCCGFFTHYATDTTFHPFVYAHSLTAEGQYSGNTHCTLEHQLETLHYRREGHATGLPVQMGGFAALDDAQRKRLPPRFPLRFRASSLTPRFRRAVWKPVFRTR